MYLPQHFAETRVETLHDFMRTNPFAALVALTANGLEANHLPFELDPEPVPFGTLRGHIARGNQLWRQVSADTEALAIFQGPHTYVSPSWYPSKRESGKVVPTWNYIVVHAYGRLRFIDDKVWLHQLVNQLTTRYETGRPEPWQVSDAPEEYIDKQLGAIVGVEVQISRLSGKWKVSQNRSLADRQGVVEGLLREDTPSATAMAEVMRQRE
jgi:transcriptional regulator